MSVIHLDATVLSTLQDVMEAGYPMLVEVFLQDSQQRLARLRQLQELQASVQDAAVNSVNDEISITAHGFKGSCANMGATELAELCRQLETLCRARSLAATAFDGLLDAIEREYSIVRRLFELEHSFH